MAVLEISVNFSAEPRFHSALGQTWTCRDHNLQILAAIGPSPCIVLFSRKCMLKPRDFKVGDLMTAT